MLALFWDCVCVDNKGLALSHSKMKEIVPTGVEGSKKFVVTPR